MKNFLMNTMYGLGAIVGLVLVSGLILTVVTIPIHLVTGLSLNDASAVTAMGLLAISSFYSIGLMVRR